MGAGARVRLVAVLMWSGENNYPYYPPIPTSPLTSAITFRHKMLLNVDKCFQLTNPLNVRPKFLYLII